MDVKEFAKKNIEEYLEQLGSAEPTPGGGAAAALVSAQGAALIKMVANLTIGKEKYAEHEELCKNVLSEAEEICEKLASGMDRDAAAFGNVNAAYSLQDPEVREQAIANASVDAAEAPIAVMEDSLRGIELAKSLLGHSNPNLESDIYVAVLCLIAGLKSAAYNVAANLAAIRTVYPDIAARLQSRAGELIAASRELEREISQVKK